MPKQVTTWIACVSTLLLCALAFADVSADELVAQGKSQFKAKQYAAAMGTFRSLIEDHSRHEEVSSGNAHWYVGRCLTADDRHADAAAALSEYRAAHPKGDGSKKMAKKGDELKEDMDNLVDEIDAVLEENAEEFVKNYVQRGGQ